MKYAYVRSTRERERERMPGYMSSIYGMQGSSISRRCATLHFFMCLTLCCPVYSSLFLLPRFDSSPGQSKHCSNSTVSTARTPFPSAQLSFAQSVQVCFHKTRKIILLSRDEKSKERRTRKKNKNLEKL